jgi:hypothetical protein
MTEYKFNVRQTVRFKAREDTEVFIEGVVHDRIRTFKHGALYLIKTAGEELPVWKEEKELKFKKK